MSLLENRINTTAKLGDLFRHLANSHPWPGYESGVSQEEYQNGLEAITLAVHQNGWFTPDTVRKALKAWADQLTNEHLNKWLKPYTLESSNKKKVAIIAAGNIPLVGLHDLLSVILSGNHALIKLSSKDTLLMTMAINYIKLLDPELGQEITIVRGKLEDYTAVIATGSNNSSRYFDYYFKDKPSIIRKNRTSVAVINGTETEDHLYGLAQDVFTYFGLGCRNVTKLYVPLQYDLNQLFKAFYHFKDIAQHNKYANNYDYHRAIWLMNQEDLLENGFLLMKQDESLVSPVGTLYYQYYSDESVLREHLDEKNEEIQCIVSLKDIPFGQAQKPALWDYADGVDTLKFLENLS